SVTATPKRIRGFPAITSGSELRTEPADGQTGHPERQRGRPGDDDPLLRRACREGDSREGDREQEEQRAERAPLRSPVHARDGSQADSGSGSPSPPEYGLPSSSASVWPRAASSGSRSSSRSSYELSVTSHAYPEVAADTLTRVPRGVAQLVERRSPKP